jgi:hypothetical protein
MERTGEGEEEGERELLTGQGPQRQLREWH